MRVTDSWQILASWVTLSHLRAFITASSSYTQEKWLNKHSIREIANISLATNRECYTEPTENKGSLSFAYITTRKCSTQKQSATVVFFPQHCRGDWLHQRAALYTNFAYLLKRQIPRGRPTTNNTAVYWQTALARIIYCLSSFMHLMDYAFI